jgi:HEAT repeat protein
MGATSTDEASSRTQMMVTLLRLMDRANAMPVIEQALASPHFYTRWHVMREMLALDAEAALPSLRRMAASDPHPEVRFAATQALSLFFEDEEEEAMLCRA